MIDGGARPEDCGNRAIRSGTASDGTVGLRAIESEGGKTGKFHTQKITEKLGIHTGAVLTAYAIRHGIAYAEYGFAVTSRASVGAGRHPTESFTPCG
jgi:hypothetical protein